MTTSGENYALQFLLHFTFGRVNYRDYKRVIATLAYIKFTVSINSPLLNRLKDTCHFQR